MDVFKTKSDHDKYLDAMERQRQKYKPSQEEMYRAVLGRIEAEMPAEEHRYRAPSRHDDLARQIASGLFRYKLRAGLLSIAISAAFVIFCMAALVLVHLVDGK